MVTLSHNNHFRFGYNGNAFNFRTSLDDHWQVSYGRCRRPVSNWGEECLNTARLIRQETSQPIFVLFSGGIDSEVVVQSFLKAQIPVRAAILRFKKDLNIHDISYAVIFCEQNNVPYYFFDLDIEEFFESGLAWDYADLTQSVSPQFLPTMWCMDQIDGYPVLGSGECYLVKRNESANIYGVKEDSFSLPENLVGDLTTWDLWEKEKVAALYRFLIARNREGCAGFFQFNPENMLAFLREPILLDLVQNRMPGKISTSSSKYQIYSRHFSLLPRPKYTGYEKIMDLDKAFRAQLEKKYPGSNQIFRTPYPALIRNLEPELSCFA